MDDKFQNKYRISSTRLQNWDYGWNAPYFVTICTKNREHYFGKIVDGEMQLSDIGKIVESEWVKSPVIRPDMNLELGAFVVMPNHFHGIVIIGKNKYNRRDDGGGDDNGDGDGVGGGDDDYCGRGGDDDYCGRGGRDAMHCVSTDTDIDTNTVTNTNTKTKIKNQFGPQRKNLASIIRGFKSSVTIQAHKTGADFTWQSLYDDRIIPNNQSFDRIRNYINTNIKNWKNDDFYK